MSRRTRRSPNGPRLKLAESILAADDCGEPVTVTVPEWNARFSLRRLTDAEADAYLMANVVREGPDKGTPRPGAGVRLIIACAVNADGKAVFKAEDEERLGEKPCTLIDDLVADARRVNDHLEERCRLLTRRAATVELATAGDTLDEELVPAPPGCAVALNGPYRVSRNWHQLLCDEPFELNHAVTAWVETATGLVDDLTDRSYLQVLSSAVKNSFSLCPGSRPPVIPHDFYPLTDLLVEQCRRWHIEPRPLTDFLSTCERFFRNRVPEYGRKLREGERPKDPTREEMEASCRGALAVLRALNNAAVVFDGKPSAGPPGAPDGWRISLPQTNGIQIIATAMQKLDPGRQDEAALQITALGGLWYDIPGHGRKKVPESVDDVFRALEENGPLGTADLIVKAGSTRAARVLREFKKKLKLPDALISTPGKKGHGKYGVNLTRPNPPK